jgi:high affinity cAMP-specific 3',5'-cyclic phosphodiesterase 7
VRLTNNQHPARPLMHEKVETSLVLTVAIKFADLGHAHKPFNLHKLWTDRVTEEFWRLGDKEKKSGVGISPLCDREKDVNIPKQQIGFFQFVCNPFFRAVAQARLHALDSHDLSDPLVGCLCFYAAQFLCTTR